MKIWEINEDLALMNFNRLIEVIGNNVKYA